MTAIDNQARTFLTVNNRYANLEKEWVKSKAIPDVAMRVEQPQRRDFLSVVLSRRSLTPTTTAVSETEITVDWLPGRSTRDAVAVFSRGDVQAATGVRAEVRGYAVP